MEQNIVLIPGSNLGPISRCSSTRLVAATGWPAMRGKPPRSTSSGPPTGRPGLTQPTRRRARSSMLPAVAARAWWRRRGRYLTRCSYRRPP